MFQAMVELTQLLLLELFCLQALPLKTLAIPLNETFWHASRPFLDAVPPQCRGVTASASEALAATGHSSEKTNERISAKRVRPPKRPSEREVRKVVQEVVHLKWYGSTARRGAKKAVA